MKNRLLAVVLLGTSLVASGSIGAFAQQDQHHPDAKPAHEMMGSCPMMSQMGEMKTHHDQMSSLLTQLQDSMKAIAAEKDPTALRQRLAAHQILLDQMQSHMASMDHGDMMKNMSCDMPMMDKQPVAPK